MAYLGEASSITLSSKKIIQNMATTLASGRKQGARTSLTDERKTPLAACVIAAGLLAVAVTFCDQQAVTSCASASQKKRRRKNVKCLHCFCASESLPRPS